MERLLTPEQAGEILGLGVEATRQLCKDGQLEYVRLGRSDRGQIRIRPSALEAFIEGRVVRVRDTTNPALARIRERRKQQPA